MKCLQRAHCHHPLPPPVYSIQFAGCQSFNGDLSKWNTRRVSRARFAHALPPIRLRTTGMTPAPDTTPLADPVARGRPTTEPHHRLTTHYPATALPLRPHDVRKVVSMDFMFKDAINFAPIESHTQHDIAKWDTGRVKSFYRCVSACVSARVRE